MMLWLCGFQSAFTLWQVSRAEWGWVLFDALLAALCYARHAWYRPRAEPPAGRHP